MLAATAACGTHERLRTVDSSCLSFRAISYAQLPAGVTDDPGNVADSAPTVAELEVHNARYDALCPRKQP
jgi:hypothetical protein